MSYQPELKKMLAEIQEVIHGYVGNNAKTSILMKENKLSINIGIEGISEIDISISKKTIDAYDTYKTKP